MAERTRAGRMLLAIRAAGLHGITPRDLVAIVYDDADGGPAWALSCIRVMAHRAKKRGLIRADGHTWKARYYDTTPPDSIPLAPLCLDPERTGSE